MHLSFVKKGDLTIMRKKISLMLVTAMTAAMLLAGCGDSKTSDTSAKKETTEEAKKDDSKDSKKTEEKKESKDTKETEESTEGKEEDNTKEKTEKKTEGDTEANDGTEEIPSGIDPENIYGGVWAQSAIVDGLDYLAESQGLSNMKSVSLEKSSYDGEDHWLVGFQDIDDSKGDVYYVYVNEDGCKYGGSESGAIAVVGGDDMQDYEDGQDRYGGMTELEAEDILLQNLGGGEIVSAEQAYLRNQEKWYIGVKPADGGDISYYYVDSNEIVPQS